MKTEDIIVCFNLLELEKLQQRLEEALHGKVTASSNFSDAALTLSDT